jgi:hypothetical protein
MGVRGAEFALFSIQKAWACTLVISAHARAVWTFGTPHTETIPANASVSEESLLMNQLAREDRQLQTFSGYLFEPPRFIGARPLTTRGPSQHEGLVTYRRTCRH